MNSNELQIIGAIRLVRKKGCKKLIVRVKQDGQVYVTVPWLYPKGQIERFILQNAEWIRTQQNKSAAKRKYITESRTHFTHFHSLEIAKAADESLRIFVKDGVMKAIVPHSLPIERQQIQDALRKSIELVLKKEAQTYLPQRTMLLAKEYGFQVSEIKFSSAKTRWGCCNSQKRIIFSYFLMTLPFHLIDYVILHELCHTIYMNHSKEFYALLDRCCGGKSKQYRAEMKQCAIDIFPKFAEGEE